MHTVFPQFLGLYTLSQGELAMPWIWLALKGSCVGGLVLSIKVVGPLRGGAQWEVSKSIIGVEIPGSLASCFGDVILLSCRGSYHSPWGPQQGQADTDIMSLTLQNCELNKPLYFLNLACLRCFILAMQHELIQRYNKKELQWPFSPNEHQSTVLQLLPANELSSLL
jgi:hypothetical protein